MAVGLSTWDGHEQMSCLNTAGVDVYARNLDVVVTEHIEHFYILQQFLQFHIA